MANFTKSVVVHLPSNFTHLKRTFSLNNLNSVVKSTPNMILTVVQNNKRITKNMKMTKRKKNNKMYFGKIPLVIVIVGSFHRNLTYKFAR